MKRYFCQLLFLTILTRVHPESVPCGEPYLADNGRSCFPCPKGFFKSSECEHNYTLANCKPCGHGTYQPDCTTALMCAPCQRCKVLQTKLADCNATHNTVCECQNGTVWVPDAVKGDEGFCMVHSICSPGQGLERRGNAYVDTKCVNCIQGESFSNISSLDQCKVCTSCTKYKRYCTVTMDSVCDDETEHVYPIGDNGSFLDVGSIIALAVVIPLVLLIAAVVIFAVWFYGRRHQNSTEEKQMSNLAQDEEHSVTSDDRSDENEEETSRCTSTVRSSFSTEQSFISNTKSASSVTYANSHNDDESMGERHTGVSLYSRQQTAECSDEHVTKRNSDVETRVSKAYDYEIQRREKQSFEDTQSQFGNGGQNNSSQTPTHCKVPNRASQKTAADNSSVPLGDRSKNVTTEPKIKTAQLLSGQRLEHNSTSMDVVGVPPEDGQIQIFNQVQNSEGHCLLYQKDPYYSSALHGDRHQLVSGLTVNLYVSQSSCHDQNGRGSPEQDQRAQASRSRPIFEAEISQPVTSLTSDDRTWKEIANFLIDNLPINNFTRFFRRLAEMMNNNSYNHDTDIKNTFMECNESREAMYQLMMKLRQVVPSCSPQDVLLALEKCNYRQERDKLTMLLQLRKETLL